MNMKTASAAASVMGAASKASNFASQTVGTARNEVLKEPLGFIKIIEFFIAIITFAVAVNGGERVSFTSTCKIPSTATETFIADYHYPYDIGNTQWLYINAPLCYPANASTMSMVGKSSSTSVFTAAGFFVFTGVASFLYSIAFIVIYVFFRQKYDNNVFIPIIDFISTALLALFWFAGSIAWSSAVNSIKNLTDPNTYLGIIDMCNNLGGLSATCTPASPYPNYATLIVSCIFGFANFLIWVGNGWFVLKETAWYKNKYQVNQNTNNSAPSNSSSGGF